MKRILILGSTGSIGTQALEVIADNRDKFEVVGIAAGGANPDLVVEQARTFNLSADRVAVANTQAAAKVADALGGAVVSSAAQLVREVEADTVLNALVGSMGLEATLATIEAGEILALANKESLVAGGSIVMDKVKPGQLIPVDSEHSAMAQCLRSGERGELARLVLTASGGPFRGWTREQMWEVTPEQAAAHPTWSMGQMNTLNSATLVNKGLELIEATLLFDIEAELIDVSVHPQSIIHSMATFKDGSTIAQASPPSMKLPISLALNWPYRVPDAQPALDFTQSMQWQFEPVGEAFSAVQLAADVAGKGSLPAVYNAVNEEAAEAFLEGKIKFPQIVDCITEVLDSASEFAGVPSSVDDVLAVEAEARQRAQKILSAWSSR
ncbi:1-deoxy-D-xylulose-5-phosphate reductoisomerase [Corynebacterium ammoniagenes]|uniref:1-deoxy-D-xylulose 5-phosphate reductoisomerase n=2 Tax=Corynebacterium ammoniagenes TaxID=1697 RepID=A0AAV5G7G3_CORAM|nr:1-deoxy-D-xylulose-5-phosphate reductoisomerase [Corynebacterium ammoniagenes]APT82417.1 1-deoxy-D-xylulose 5-phosphate reductoisomerase [Corynebacterium ammoniagenes DSM 20306]AQS73500.1 1-deoxy-D-xylulose-5-phosphate reductoisomerase [Corynebacterium ammoniagenes]EFG82627.1 1-deoxy-D-xylulose 5-phosphate reductoisomerase [Corynebacterium ammoniagenes DSM 20306]NMF30975.1 1-deoxy-D-xylulose-5-phosphate reductoisomerase [Corynebacterium ammoniagenes]GJN42245.1 1-deoxy-D-xylulose 5-phosphate